MAEKRKILFLASNPKDSGHLRLEDEAKLINASLRSNGNEEAFQFYNVGAATITDLRQSLLNYKPDIVHFSGHGSKEDTILFEDEEGFTKEINSDDLGEFFHHFADTVECVILNACYSLSQADGLKRNIRILIGMSSEIPNDSAKIFTSAFYDALCAECEIEEAFRIAKSSLKLEQQGDGHIPMIHINDQLDATHGEVSASAKEDLLISADYFVETKNSAKNKIKFFIGCTSLILIVAGISAFYFWEHDTYALYISSSLTLLSGIPVFEILKKRGDITFCELLWKNRQKLQSKIAAAKMIDIEKFNKYAHDSLMKILRSGRL